MSDVTAQAFREAATAIFTNDVIRAIGALARQQNVCREQDGKAIFVTGMEAAREYIIEHVELAAAEQREELDKTMLELGMVLIDKEMLTAERDALKVSQLADLDHPEGVLRQAALVDETKTASIDVTAQAFREAAAHE